MPCRAQRRACGYTEDVLVHRLDEVLAKTDPFDLAQAVERHVRTLPAKEIRKLIRAARPRMNGYYAAEFERVIENDNEASLRSAFAQSLKSNLRVIPLFGQQFSQAILAKAPAERAVGFGDEPPRRSQRWVAAAVVVTALGAAAAGGAHYVTAVRAQAVSTAATPHIVLPPVKVKAPTRRVLAQAAAPPVRTVRPSAQAPAAAPEHAAAPRHAAPQPPTKARPRRSPPAAHGSGTGVVAVAQPAPTRTPADEGAPQQASMNLTDMPEPYSDATPMPAESAAAVAAPHNVRLKTPAPAPRGHGWLHRAIMHLDPFKPNPRPTP